MDTGYSDESTQAEREARRAAHRPLHPTSPTNSE